MSDPTADSGSSSDRPTVEQNNNNKTLPRALGDSFSGEGNGRSVTVNTADSYLEISPHISEFEGLSEGTISFGLTLPAVGTVPFSVHPIPMKTKLILE